MNAVTQRAERPDAARNRAKILAAAGEIVREHGVDALAMADVAAAAGVGVGTLYRRFGDRSGLAYALIDDREREFQAAFLEGPPPLGPGAPARDRLRAFLHALAARTAEQLDLLLMAETATASARFSGAYAAYHAHLTMLLTQLKPGTDTGFLADALLAPTAAPLFAHRLRDSGWTLDRINAGFDALLDGIG